MRGLLLRRSAEVLHFHARLQALLIGFRVGEILTLAIFAGLEQPAGLNGFFVALFGRFALLGARRREIFLNSGGGVLLSLLSRYPIVRHGKLALLGGARLRGGRRSVRSRALARLDEL